MRPHALLLDLDGTLIDTEALIFASLRAICDAYGLGVADEAFRQGLGQPLELALAALAPDIDVGELVAAYRNHNDAIHDAMVRPFPGIPEVMARLVDAGVPIAIVTSKSRAFAERGLALTALPYDVLFTPTDTARSKPHPEPVWAALKALGVDANDAVMIGDSPHDIAAGRAAGVVTAAVRWGMFGVDVFLKHPPDRWLETPQDLWDLAFEEF